MIDEFDFADYAVDGEADNVTDMDDLLTSYQKFGYLELDKLLKDGLI